MEKTEKVYRIAEHTIQTGAGVLQIFVVHECVNANDLAAVGEELGRFDTLLKATEFIKWKKKADREEAGAGEFIVGELVKNWINGVQENNSPLISMQLENMIKIQHARGYTFHSFQLSTNRGIFKDELLMQETIVAVFRRI